MSTRHRRTLQAVFRDPVSATIVWDDVERMLVHHGATIRERSGSRIAVTLGGRTLTVHRPHPEKEARQHTIRDVRDFLTLAGVKP
jgi:hypothetical protein